MSKITETIFKDEADEYQSSGGEWIKSEEKKRTPRRTSQRLRKKPRISLDLAYSSDSENEKVTERKKKPNKIPKTYPRKCLPIGLRIFNNDSFITGSFVVLKKDVQTGDSSKPPCLWRIDGKALLQKFEVFEENGKTLHRNTSIYTGWSPLDKDLYAPVNVCVRWHTSQQMNVELDWETLKNATIDSD